MLTLVLSALLKIIELTCDQTFSHLRLLLRVEDTVHQYTVHFTLKRPIVFTDLHCFLVLLSFCLLLLYVIFGCVFYTR